MTAISRADLMKELLPGLNKLFGVEYDNYAEDYAVSQIMQEIEADSSREFIDRETYLRVVRNYEERLAKERSELVASAKKEHIQGVTEGWSQAAALVEDMANEIGTSNILHATALAVRVKAESR